MKKQESFKDAPTIKVHVFWEISKVYLKSLSNVIFFFG